MLLSFTYYTQIIPILAWIAFSCSVIELIWGWIEVWIQALIYIKYMYSISEYYPDVASEDYEYEQDTIYVTITKY